MRTLTKQLENEVLSPEDSVLWAVKSDSIGTHRARFLGTDLRIIPNFPLRLSLWDNFSAPERKLVAQREWEVDRSECISSHVSGLCFEYLPSRTSCSHAIEFDETSLRDASSSIDLPPEGIRILGAQGFQVLNEFGVETKAVEGVRVRIGVRQNLPVNYDDDASPELRTA